MFTLSMTQNVFLTWLHLQFDSGEQSIRAWREAWWGQEAELSMSSSKQKANPDLTENQFLVKATLLVLQILFNCCVCV